MLWAQPFTDLTVDMTIPRILFYVTNHSKHMHGQHMLNKMVHMASLILKWRWLFRHVLQGDEGWAQVHCWPLMVGHRLTWTGAASWARWEDPPAEEQLLSCLPRHQARSSEWISLTISSLQKPVCAQSWIVHVGWGRTASQWGRIILENEAEGPTWCSQTSPSHSKYIHNPLVSIYKVWGVLSLQTSTLLHQVQQQQHWRYWNLLPQQPQSAQQLQIWTQTRARMTDN